LGLAHSHGASALELVLPEAESLALLADHVLELLGHDERGRPVRAEPTLANVSKTLCFRADLYPPFLRLGFLGERARRS